MAKDKEKKIILCTSVKAQTAEFLNTRAKELGHSDKRRAGVGKVIDLMVLEAHINNKMRGK